MKIYQNIVVAVIAAVFLCCGCGGQLKIESGGMMQDGDSFLADWTEHLPEWEGQLGPFDGRLNLDEDEWLTVKAEHYFDMGAQGTFLIRSKEEVRFLQEKIIDNSTGIISLSEPQIMRGWNPEWQPAWGGAAKVQDYFYGLYNISDDKWILEPIYDYIGNSDCGYHYSINTSTSDNTKDIYSFYDNGWNLLWSKELGSNDMYEVGDYMWIMDLSGVWDSVDWLTTSIYTMEGELVRTLKSPSLIEKPSNGSYNGWLYGGDIMCNWSEDNSLCIYNPDGSLLFDRSMIPDSICAQMNGEGVGINAGIIVVDCLWDGRLSILGCGDKKFLYDIEAQELLSGPEDRLESWGRIPKAVIVKHPDETRIIYQYDRTSPETSQGLPYLYLVNGDGEDDKQYYYRIDDGTVTLGDGEGMEYTYHGNFDENTWINPYEGKLVQLKERGSDSVTYVYLQEELVMSGTDLETYSRGYSIKDETTGEIITMDENGNYHKSDRNQSVCKMGTDFVVTTEKETLFSVIDENGRPVVRLPRDYRYPAN